MTATSPWPIIHTERAALAADLAGLDDRAWSTPSLCAGRRFTQARGGGGGADVPSYARSLLPARARRARGQGRGGKEGRPDPATPSAPGEPPGDKVLGPVTGLLDRMRDAVSKRGTQS